MAPRLRILELPTEVSGEHVNTPFVLVIDRADGADFTSLAGAACEQLGARGILAFDFEIDIEP